MHEEVSRRQGRGERPRTEERPDVGEKAKTQEKPSANREKEIRSTDGPANGASDSAASPSEPDNTVEDQAGSAKNEAKPMTANRASGQIDKTDLQINTPKRVRDKEHLRYVASKPCLICGRAPSHAHHLRFAQPRALGRKVSDEWVVPLCATHHRALHGVGDEKRGWKEMGIEPIGHANRLWYETRHPFPEWARGEPTQIQRDEALNASRE